MRRGRRAPLGAGGGRAGRFGSHGSPWSSSGARRRSWPRSWPRCRRGGAEPANSRGFPFAVVPDLLLGSGWSKAPRRSRFPVPERWEQGLAQPLSPELRRAAGQRVWCWCGGFGSGSAPCRGEPGCTPQVLRPRCQQPALALVPAALGGEFLGSRPPQLTSAITRSALEVTASCCGFWGSSRALGFREGGRDPPDVGQELPRTQLVLQCCPAQGYWGWQGAPGVCPPGSLRYRRGLEEGGGP